MQVLGFKWKLINFLNDIVFALFALTALSKTVAHAAIGETSWGYGLFGLLLLLVVVGNNVTARHYDHFLLKKIINSPLLDVMVINTTLPLSNKDVAKIRAVRLVVYYLGGVLAPRQYKKTIAYKVVDGFDFEQHVTTFEKIHAYLFFGVCFIFVTYCIVSLFYF